jgi:hypothetical protein
MPLPCSYSGLACLVPPLAAQTFQRTFGGPADEHATTAVQNRNGDYTIAGYTYSYGAGKSDIWVMRLNRRGEELWRSYLGEGDFEWATDMIETRDGGLVVAGRRTQGEGKRARNVWVFKLDDRGQVVWSQTYGGEETDEAHAVVETSDGGLAVAGFSNSFSRGKSDIWLLRLDPKGKQLWAKNYGGKASDVINDLVEVPDGGLVMVGYTESYGNGGADMLVMKVNREGKEVWRRNYGGAGNDAAEAITQTVGGDLAIAGWTGSEGKGSLDGSLLLLDSEGSYQWQHTYGGAEKDVFYDLGVLPDGQFVMVGTMSSHQAKGKALWLVKTDGFGEQQWERRLSGPKDEYGHSLALAHDGGFLLAGATQSFALGEMDMWVIKTDRHGRFQQDEAFSVPSPVNVAHANLPLPGGPKETPRPISQPTPPSLYRPNLYILTIGVSEYRDASVNLTFAHTDAEAIADRFSQMEGKIFKHVVVKKILNQDASLVNIKTGINWLERQATQNDVILIFVSSHGALDNKGNLYILPTDFNAYNLFATALNIRDLTEGINGVPCKKLILLDACHSGQSGFDLLAFNNRKAVDQDQIIRDLIEAEPGLTVMTSSSGREYSYETDSWGHGAFTKAILEGFDGQADLDANRVVTLHELNLYVSERVKTLTGGRQHPFTPINLFGNIPLFMVK